MERGGRQSCLLGLKGSSLLGKGRSGDERGVEEEEEVVVQLWPGGLGEGGLVIRCYMGLVVTAVPLNHLFGGGLGCRVSRYKVEKVYRRGAAGVVEVMLGVVMLGRRMSEIAAPCHQTWC